jgi:5-methylcytosine-specific restriction enzyme subunit McrC
VCKTTKQPDTWRLSHELAGLLAEIPSSKDIQSDFRQWKNDRLMAHYQPVRPWCELVLGQQMPLALRGKTQGISFLFPMEKLFERYLEVQLRKQLPAPYTLKSQASSLSLCKHGDRDMFQLRPDLLVQQNHKNVLVLDAKWKLISTNDKEKKYGLSQADFYQLFAYGHKYLSGKGEMLLIYPLTDSFKGVLPPFDFSTTLRLWVAPFDLKKNKMHWPAEWDETLFAQMRQTG